MVSCGALLVDLARTRKGGGRENGGLQGETSYYDVYKVGKNQSFLVLSNSKSFCRVCSHKSFGCGTFVWFPG